MKNFISLRKYWNLPVIAVAVLGTSVWQLNSCTIKTTTTDSSTQSSVTSPLATPAQLQADSLVIALLQDTAVQNAEADVLKTFAQDSVSKSSDEGLAAAKTALHGIVVIAIENVLANTPKHPDFLWFYHAAHNWYGSDVPGAKAVFDNPDNVYRVAYFDSSSHYEIHVHHNDKAPIQESFEALDGFTKQIGFIEGKKIKKDENGDYTITVNSAIDSTNPNHLRITVPVANILYRNSLSNWKEQTPTSVIVKRLDDSTAPIPRTTAELVSAAVTEIKKEAPFFNILKNKWFYGTIKPNTLGKPFVRDGGWGYAVGGLFKLGTDEAWIIKLNPTGAKYIGFQLGDSWLTSLEYIDHSGSLNNNQIVADKDGNYTYVISATDPGVNNWLDTRGLSNGGLFIRFQAFDSLPKSIDGAIISQKIVKVASIAKDSTFNYQTVTAAQRDTILAERKANYQHRLN
jgi:hypothetical protein